MRDTDWRPSPCPDCGVMREAAERPVCTNLTCEECVLYEPKHHDAILRSAVLLGSGRLVAIIWEDKKERFRDGSTVTTTPLVTCDPETGLVSTKSGTRYRIEDSDIDWDWVMAFCYPEPERPAGLVDLDQPKHGAANAYGENLGADTEAARIPPSHPRAQVVERFADKEGKLHDTLEQAYRVDLNRSLNHLSSRVGSEARDVLALEMRDNREAALALSALIREIHG